MIENKLSSVTLKMDSGKEVKNLKELQENFSITKIVGYIKDVILVSWLKNINLHDYVSKIQILYFKNPYLIERIYCIFRIKWNDDIKKYKYSVLDIILRRVKINIIATMSSGKSILINVLLGNKLMPSKK